MRQEIEVTYLDKLGNDKRVCNIARASFAKWDLNEELTERDLGLLHYLATGVAKEFRGDYEAMYKASTHWAPFAHCMLQLRCRVPIFLARQLVKHQIGLVWSEESRRYITDPVGYWLPNVIHSIPEGSIKQGSGSVHPDSQMIRQLMELHTVQGIEYYNSLIDNKVAPEEARMVLPQNAMVNFIWTGSLIALMRVLKQRQDSHAQLAAQEFAGKLRVIMEEHFPQAVKAYTDYL